MKLLNIHAKGRTVYLFCRDNEGKQEVITDNTFYPFFYEVSPEGKEVGFDGVSLKKVIVLEPSDVPKYRSQTSYSSDVLFVKNYLIHRIQQIDKCHIKYLFIDIEVSAPELPSYDNPQYTISCISVYNSMSGKIQTWYLKDFLSEEQMLTGFAKYIKQEKPDLLLAWNMENFDYPYLFFRYKKVLRRDFARDISPIDDIRRYHKIDNLNYPAGISILDYLQLFKKVFMREASYALDYIAQKHLNEQSWGQSKFNEVSEEVKKKNINDVNRMVKLEKLYQIIPYFEEIRVLTKALWEDLYFNSYIIEMLLFEEAKKKRVVLPNCTRNEENEESTFEGAIRECLESGALFNIGKFDLTSAYPNMVRNFCLDPRNITAKKSDKTIEVNGYNWEQNSTALLPSLIEKLLTLKDTLKKEVKKYTADTPEFKKAQIKYDAIKGVVNSAFGVMGFPSFRLYDNKVASTITFLVRDLLNYVTLQIRKEGYIVVYYDTDSVFIKTTENIAPKLNTLIRQWAKEKYGKDDISIDFEYEGYFEKIFLLTKCRYYGYLKTSKGVKTEIKGMEIKRASSSKYESEFQKNLIEKILNQDAKDNIIGWIKQEKERIKTLPLEQTAFPCKLSNREYKNIPIFVRAYNNTKALVPDFSVEKGEIFYYVFIDSPYPTRNVLAFTDKDKRVLKNERIDYTELIRRNIDMKTATIFEALGWDSNIILSTQLSLF